MAHLGLLFSLAIRCVIQWVSGPEALNLIVILQAQPDHAGARMPKNEGEAGTPLPPRCRSQTVNPTRVNRRVSRRRGLR